MKAVAALRAPLTDTPSTSNGGVGSSAGRRRSMLGRLPGSGTARPAVFKIGRAVLVVMTATMLTQWLLDRAPGGVAATILGDGASPENVAELNTELGLDRPFFVRYFDWAGDVVTGDLGRSPITNRSVGEAISTALPVTVEIVLLATVIALSMALASTFLSVRRPGGAIDRLFGTVSSAALAVPTFVLAPVLLYFLAVEAGVFPVTGWVPLSEGLAANLETAVLPAVAVAIPEFAVFHRLLRGDLVATMEEDFIAAARARGISESRILVRHAFRPASISLMTVLGISTGRLLGGTVVVESLFALPGLGLLLQQSILQRDLILVQGIVVFLAATYVLINLVVDLLYGVVDPRIGARVGR